ncbi:MAG: DUF885 domain-containing protein [Candidatus Zixiibacteriota bacterium]
MSYSELCKVFLAERGTVPEPDRLHKFFRASWEHRLEENPEFATEFGYPGHNDRWTDLSPETIARRKREVTDQLKVLQSIDRSALNETDQLSYDLFARSLQDANDGNRFPSELLPISQMHGIQQDIPRLMGMMPIQTKAQIGDILARLEKIPELVDQTLALLDEGLRQGITPPRVTLSDVPDQVKAQAVKDVEMAPILSPIRKFDDSCAESSAEVKRSAKLCYLEKVVPAFENLRRYLIGRYLPGCRSTTAWSEFPEGKDWYAYLVRHHTTTTLTPDEVHEIGLAEVTGIRREMESVIAQTGFKGDFASFCDWLRTDQRFFCATAAELVTKYREIAKRADPELAKLFGRLPRLPYGVIPIPPHEEKSQTTGYYQPGSVKAGRAGYYFVNTYNLPSRPIWEMEALSLHEAVPGHHLQIALAQEMAELPEFRRFSWITAYGEGWALYAESLGREMGFYQDPFSRFGQLTYEMWRAIRLVVDPGMHAKGWSRQHAIDYFKANSSKSLHDIAVEIDRYLVWPGQALAYKIGELRITRLRKNAEKLLGERFDIRAFHDELLRYGCLPLDTLELQIGRWLEQQSAGA